uniref:ATP synthase subunit a n=1 Tax=Hydrosaurus amboinensis TaxID=588074 RepID=D6RS40_9SAUR|nr:ATP synthase F0 subunit 6 [Hydrosaurus amboinensis]BAJ08130.1 ATPase subunit 6 [Hydrosaurus amboinensis]
MMANLFDQFTIPTVMGLKLLPLIMMVPPLITITKTNRLENNRLTTLTLWAIKKTTKNFMLPLSKQGQKWAPMFTTLIMFILTLNIIGLFPYTFTPTTQLSMNLALALPLWLATVLIGLRTQPTKSLAHLLPEGTPTTLIPLLIMIETISLLIRPLALGVRLTANLTAGHILLQLFSSATMTTIELYPMMTLLPTTILIMLTILEIAVATIQAYVFTLLLNLYLQENS